MESRDKMEIMEHLERVALLVYQGPRDQLDNLVPPVRMGQQGRQDLQDLEVNQELRDQMDLLVLPDSMDPREPQDRPDLLVFPVR